MAIIKNKYKSNFTVIPNEIIVSEALSDGDFRLLTLLYYLPDNIKITQEKLAIKMNCNRRNLNSKLSRIKEAGFLKISKHDDDYIYELTLPNVSVNDIQSELPNDIDSVSIGDTEPVSVNDIHNKDYKNKDYKNKKENIKRNQTFFENKEINDLFLDFLKLRVKLKAVNTERAVNNLLNKLNKVDDNTKKLMIDRSITNSWKDLYPIKNSAEQSNDNEIVDYVIFEGYVYGIPKKGSWIGLRKASEEDERRIRQA